MAIADDRPLQINDSLFGFGLRLSAPVALALIAAAGFWQGSLRSPVPIVFSVVAAFFFVVVLFDMPWAVGFDAEGVHRRCLLRTHTIDWDSVTAMERFPSARRRPQRGAIARMVRNDVVRRPVGLSVRIGKKKRYILLNRAERPDEWDVLSSRLKIWAPHVPLPGRPLS